MPHDRYEIIKELGSGSEGVTHLLKSLATGKSVVRKRVFNFVWDGEVPREVMILRETLGLHRNIINLIDYRVDPAPNSRRREILSMQFDHCAGGDLGRYESGGTDEDFLWHVFLGVAKALTYMHYGLTLSPMYRSRRRSEWMPVIHRDIKPDNIFLKQRRTPENPFPDIVLGDFGFATLEQLSKYGGAPTYAPPEGEYSTRSDVWALGATIHIMAHGRLPVDEMPHNWRAGLVAWLKSEESKNPEPLPRNYSSRLNEIMMDCLEEDPERRITSAELVEMLRRDCPPF